MATVFRVGMVRLQGSHPITGFLQNISACPPSTSSRSIMSRAMRGGPRQPKGKPWNYREKKYGVLQSIMDKTSWRMDENSKVICVEGPVAAGKTKFAQALATELDMLYVPHANMDSVFVNTYGFDLRKLDPQLPKMCRSFDEKNFCREPTHPLVAQFQIRMYMLRYSAYIDGIAHLLSTGQGIVFDRSPYSDFVFMEAMLANGFVSKGAHSVYYEVLNNSINELLRPHLVIYLDCPVEEVKKRIKDRKLAYETNSKALTDDYLCSMEHYYKQQFLKNISSHSEILVYDWTQGETEVVIEDIERIDFDEFEKDFYNKKMKDWRFFSEIEWCEARIKYCRDKAMLMNYFNIPRFDVPELVREAEDGQIWREVWTNAPGMKYRPGYNEDMGDKDLLFKNKIPYNDITW